ncbi:acyltransferase family protein [Duganella sp. CY15W]|uniref:acyltransferase family protein n=1 Tax=Duganella sp. CY15W TaxID=2692172 RepID=UPI00136D88E7|nr:acyltransferase [Duganella sp. CY15W]MYM30255.1 acyltransferase family protein [Duganella sp. CY15W]
MKSLNLPYSVRIDQLRWFAATLVFLFHFELKWRNLGGGGIDSKWAGLIIEGHTGVALFFTLSGFLFMRIAQFQRQIAYAPFVRNRVLRIAPLYLTIFVLALSLNRDSFQPQDLFYLFTANLGDSPTSRNLITGAAWCIPLEFMFYLLFPWLSRFAMERGMRYLLQLLAMLLIFKLMAYRESVHSSLMYFSTFVGRFDQFVMGMLAAMLYQRHQLWLQRWAGWLLLPALLLAAGASALQAHVAPYNVAPHAPFWISWSMMESLVWAGVILSWVSWQGRLPGWLERGLAHGGKISFSFYLLHMGVIQMLAQKFGLPHWTGIAWLDAGLVLVTVYGLVWAVATLSYHTIEEPFLRLRGSYGAVRL